MLLTTDQMHKNKTIYISLTQDEYVLKYKNKRINCFLSKNVLNMRK